MDAVTSINLQKDQKVDLTKGNPALVIICCGLGWDVNQGNAAAFDLDAFAIALKEKKVYTKDAGSLLYFNSPKLNGKPAILNGAVVHSGDNLTGQGDGDDETITVELEKVPQDVEELKFFVNIYEAQSRSQRFGSVKNAFIRLYDGSTNQELCKYDLSEDFSNYTGVLMGRMYRHNGEWKFEALGQGVNGDITSITQSYF